VNQRPLSVVQFVTISGVHPCTSSDHFKPTWAYETEPRANSGVATVNNPNDYTVNVIEVDNPSTDPFDLDGLSFSFSGPAGGYYLTGTSYQVDVQFTNGSAQSPWVSVPMTGTADWPLTTPTNLTETNNSNGSVSFSWSEPSSPNSYSIYGITTSNQAVLLGTSSTTSATIAAANIASNVDEAFVVQNVYEGPPGYSIYSNIVAISATTPPAAPTHLTDVITSSSPMHVALVWNNTPNNEAGYIVQREDLSQSSPTWSTIGTTSYDQTNFTDSPPSATDAYAYQVLAYNAGGNSAASNEVKIVYGPLVTLSPVQSAVEGSPVTVTPTIASSIASDSIKYIWTIYDNGSVFVPPTGVVTDASTLTFTPNAPGNWSVNLSIDDTSYNIAASASTGSFVVSNLAPVIAASGPATATYGQAYTITFSVQYPANYPNGDSIQQWFVDWGDGSATAIYAANAASATHVFQSNFTADISVTAANDVGVYAASPFLVAVTGAPAGLGLLSISASPVSATEIDVTYSAPGFQDVEIEEFGPGDLNYSTLTNYSVVSSNGNQETIAVTNLEPNSHYNFRVRAFVNGELEYATTAAHTNSSSSPPSLPAPTFDPRYSGGYIVDWDAPSPTTTYTATYNFVPDPENDPFGVAAYSYSMTFTGNDTYYGPNNYLLLSGPAPQDYDIDFQISDGNAVSPWASLTLGGGTQFQATATSLTASAQTNSNGSGSITVAWDLAANNYPGNSNQWLIEGITGSNTLLQLGSTTQSGSAQSGSAFSYTVQVAASIMPLVQQVFVVQALPGQYPSHGVPSFYSNIVNIQPIAPPAAPANLSATESVANGTPTVNLVWDNSSNNELGYYVQRKLASAPTSAWANIDPEPLPADTSTYKDNTLPNTNESYDYQVVAFNNGGNSGPSPLAMVQTGLAAPIDVFAEAAGGTAVRVVWNNVDPSVTGFVLTSSINGSGFSNPISVSGGTSAYIFTGLLTSTTYAFAVSTVQGSSESGATETSSITTGPVDTTGWYEVSGVPGDVSSGVIPIHHGIAAYTATSAGLLITNPAAIWAPGWQAAVYEALSGSTTVNGNVYDFPSNRYWAAYASLPGAGDPEGSLANDPKLGLSPTDQVVAFEDGTDFDYNDDYFRIIVTREKSLAAPVLTASADNTAGVVNLSWTESDGGQAGFQIWRSTNGTNYTELYTAGPNQYNYVDNTVQANQTYYYYVVAESINAGNSDPSNIASAELTSPVPMVGITGPTSVNEGQPYTLSLVAGVGVTQWTISWGDNTSSTVTGTTAPHVYTHEGNPTITAAATLSSGGSANSNALPITVVDSTPTLDPISGQTIAPNVTLPITDTFADPGMSVESYTASINWGDNQTSAAAVTLDLSTDVGTIDASHAYSSVGTYQATVSVTDHDGNTGQITFTVLVQSQPEGSIQGRVFEQVSQLDVGTTQAPTVSTLTAPTQAVTLTGGGFLNYGMAYYEPDNSVMVSGFDSQGQAVLWEIPSSGVAHIFAYLGTQVDTDELNLGSVTTDNVASGFTPGDVFIGNGPVIERVTNHGNTTAPSTMLDEFKFTSSA
jgi:fibronectin type 3 domain-containing protein